MTERYWCQQAVLDGAVQDGVSIEVAGGRFTAISAGRSPSPDARRLPGLALPGFANAHSHAFHRALRSRTQADRGTFWTWREVMYDAAGRLDPQRYHRLATAVFAEMACAGISCVGEFHYLHHGPDGRPYDDPNEMGKALLAAAAAAGIRITLLDTLYLHGGLAPEGYLPAAGVQLRYSDRSVEAWIERVDAITCADTDGGTGGESGGEAIGDTNRVGGAIHSVRAVDPAAMAVLARWADDHGAPVHAHVSEQVAENEQCRAHHGCTPIELLETAGVLCPAFTAVHATHLTADDIASLAKTGAAVCLCPTTERDLGDGIGPALSLATAGIPINLGSDSHAVVDHCIEMRAVELDGRLSAQERGLHNAGDLLHMATGAGHAALGWADAGVIEVGNRADLAVIDLNSVRTAGTPSELAIEAAVFAATASDVTTVLIDGKTIVEDGRHVDLDVEHELASAIAELFS